VERPDRQPADSVWVTSITVFEARFGLALLPKGRRRSSLERAFDRVLTEDLSSRVLNLDEMAAAVAGQLAADRAGRQTSLKSSQASLPNLMGRRQKPEDEKASGWGAISRMADGPRTVGRSIMPNPP
jgi:hypothetical protein